MTERKPGAAGRAEALRRFGDKAQSQQQRTDGDRGQQQPGDAGRAEAERRFPRRTTTDGETT
jgi:hypothetical protein